MYKLFSNELLKLASYVLVPRSDTNIFVVKHVQAKLIYAWCKVTYRITVDESVGYYTCECGLYQHFGVFCSHIIVVCP